MKLNEAYQLPTNLGWTLLALWRDLFSLWVRPNFQHLKSLQTLTSIVRAWIPIKSGPLN